MPEYFKEKNFVFRLKDETVTEEFAIWSAWDCRNEKFTDSQGQDMKFPIKEGKLSDSKGQEWEVEGLKFMKGTEFKELFPKFGKQTTYVREIIVGDKEYVFRFKMTANKKLDVLVDTIKQMGGDISKINFEQSFDKTQPAVSMYNICIKKELSVNPMPTPSNPVILTKTGTTGTIQIDEFKMDEKETEVTNAIKSLDQEPDNNAKLSIYKDNGITEERATKLIEKLFKK